MKKGNIAALDNYSSDFNSDDKAEDDIFNILYCLFDFQNRKNYANKVVISDSCIIMAIGRRYSRVLALIDDYMNSTQNEISFNVTNPYEKKDFV